jgi:hypothetical protein
MNYQKVYDQLISRAKNRYIDGYIENHHIIPKCMGGSDDPTNLVRLTPEEHYVAHQLLVKVYPKNEALIRAAIMMIPNRPSNKMYGWLKRRFSEIQSKAQTGSSNTQFGTRWILNVDTKHSKKISKKDPIPEGWIIGRRVKESNKLDLLSQERQNRKDKEKQFLQEIMYYYRDNDITMRELTKKFGVGQNVYIRFERLFKDEYHQIVKNKKGNSNISKGRY